MNRASRRFFLILGTLCALTPALCLAQREVKFTNVPNYFPAQPGDQALGPAHGGAAVDRAGNVYVSTDTDRGILVFSPDGKFLRNFGPKAVHGLFLLREKDGEYVYAARPSAHEVQKIKIDGTAVWTMGYPE